jgi:hypothetical protein
MAFLSFVFGRQRNIRPDLESAIVIRLMVEADMLPESQAGDVVIHHEEIAFLDSLLGKSGQTFLDEQQGNALFAKFFPDGEVTHNAAPAIVTTKDCPDQVPSDKRDEAQAPISFEIQCNPFAIVVLNQAHAFGPCPKSINLGIVCQLHWADFAVHCE